MVENKVKVGQKPFSGLLNSVASHDETNYQKYSLFACYSNIRKIWANFEHILSYAEF